MDVKKARYIFIFLSAILLAIMIFMSRNSGINCDEVLHYEHSVSVVNFFTTHGKDTSCLNTPLNHLQYYGQCYDNLTTVLTRLFGIEDIYGFRHLMSTIAGWLTILVSALFAVWLAGYEAGIIVILLFAVSPTFLGHSQNNLKDIPFALGYISGIYFTCRLMSNEGRTSSFDVIFLILSIAFSIGIRAGGFILICFLFLFWLAVYGLELIHKGQEVIPGALRKLGLIVLISCTGYFAGLLLWPYGLTSPLRHTFESYKVMLHYPDTFRQIFEGEMEWSDYMPWYYLPKFMLITIPVVVFLGLSSFILYINRILRSSGKQLSFLFILISIILPVLFVIVNKSNLYSGWRQFLFIYPGIIILSAAGISYLIRHRERRIMKTAVILSFILISLDPLLFIIKYPIYSYLYYNQSVGGLKGASGNYETDYYFISQKESSEWLIRYLDEKNLKDTVVIGSNFSAEWFFRKNPNIRNIYFRNEERSMNDWDYAITTNRYISPYKLRNGIWPPKDALKVIYVDNVAVSAITSRKSKADYYGYRALEEANNSAAVNFFEEALNKNSTDEMIFYNFAVALNRTGEKERADSALKECLKINPDFEPALMYLGNLAVKAGDNEIAKQYYKKLISVNRKYYEAHEALAKIDK
jgi:hypothetical protein